MQKNRRKKIKTIPPNPMISQHFISFCSSPPVYAFAFIEYSVDTVVFTKDCVRALVRGVSAWARKAFRGGDIEVENQTKWWNESWEDVGGEWVKVLSWKWVWYAQGMARPWSIAGRCVVSLAGRGRRWEWWRRQGPGHLALLRSLHVILSVTGGSEQSTDSIHVLSRSVWLLCG